MRKGLTTLMTVAIALASVQAMALAPVIDEIPSPIVGNQASSTQATKFVYVDAFDLDTLVNDDRTSDAGLKWSYEIVGTPKYTVNGVAIMDSNVDNPVAPPAAKVLAGPLAVKNTFAGATGTTYNTAPNVEDTKPQTVTIRNIDMYPYGSTPKDIQTVVGQQFSTHMQAVTFWCSDGELASAKHVMFYTDNTYTFPQGATGWNRLSGRDGSTVWTSFKAKDTTINTWKMFDPFLDKTSSSTLSGSGLCLNVTATGQNFGSVQSPMGYFSLQANMVYRIRAKMNCSQTTPGKTPFWDFIVENWNGDPAKGLNLYGMDTFFLDNEGGANAIISSSEGTDVTMYWAPLAFQTASWNNATTGLYKTTAPYTAVKDPALRFRVLDVDANVALLNNVKSGSICLQSVVVDAIPYSQMTTVSNKVDLGTATTPFVQANAAGTGNFNFARIPGLDATMAVTAGKIIVTPGAVSAVAELAEVVPASDLTYDFPGASIRDDWPLVWEANKIYKLEVGLDMADANTPWDVIWLDMAPPTNEVITESFVTATKNIGTPKATGGSQPYIMFYYSGNGSNTSGANLERLRWRVRFGNGQSLTWPENSNLVNNGRMRINNVKVDIVSFPQ